MSTHAPDAPLLVVVSCGAAKADRSATPRHLYTGPYARLALAAADTLASRATAPAAVRILSARYGLLDPDGDRIQPYEATLPERARPETWELFWRHRPGARELEEAREVLVLAGRRYLDAVRSVRPDAHRPAAFERSRGIGDQLAVLRALANHADPWSQVGVVG